MSVFAFGLLFVFLGMLGMVFSILLRIETPNFLKSKTKYCGWAFLVSILVCGSAMATVSNETNVRFTSFERDCFSAGGNRVESTDHAGWTCWNTDDGRRIFLAD